MSRTRTAVDTPLSVVVAVLSVGPVDLSPADPPARLRLLALEVRPGGGEWMLPQTEPVAEESLENAALRALREQAGVFGVRPRVLAADLPGDPAKPGDPDPPSDADMPGDADLPVDADISVDAAAGGIVDVVTYDLLRDHLARPGLRLVDAGFPGRLPARHAAVLGLAVAQTRRAYRFAPDPAGLLPHEFTLRELLGVHAAVAGVDLVRDTFRRSMAETLVATGRLSSGALGRPAAMYRRGR